MTIVERVPVLNEGGLPRRRRSPGGPNDQACPFLIETEVCGTLSRAQEGGV